MAEKVTLPTYETSLTDAIISLALDSGMVTSPAAVGTNVLSDSAKNWANSIHKNRLVKIVRGAGAGQMAVIQDNTAESLVIKQSWVEALNTTSAYMILDVDIVSEFASLATEDTLAKLTPTGVADGRKTVTAAGTAEALATSTSCKLVIITAETDNTDYVVVGGSTVVAALATRRGVPLAPGDSVPIQTDNLADIYLDAVVSGEGVTYLYLT
jgi:hypothetical protein